MERNDTAPYGAFVLRLAIGAMFIAHSVFLKYFMYTLPGTAKFFESLGLPGFSAYVVFSAEAIGGVLLLLGVKTRWVATALLPVLLGAAWVHSRNGWLFTNTGGGWEYPVFLAVATAALALIGDGAWSLEKRLAY